MKPFPPPKPGPRLTLEQRRRVKRLQAPPAVVARIDRLLAARPANRLPL